MAFSRPSYSSNNRIPTRRSTTAITSEMLATLLGFSQGFVYAAEFDPGRGIWRLHITGEAEPIVPEAQEAPEVAHEMPLELIEQFKAWGDSHYE